MTVLTTVRFYEEIDTSLNKTKFSAALKDDCSSRMHGCLTRHNNNNNLFKVGYLSTVKHNEFE